MGNEVLWVEGIGKTFRKPGNTAGEEKVLHALRDVSFTLRAGEVCGVIGHNGAGKSTLLKILSEITPPSSGQIRYKGRYTSILNVGTGFHPDLSGKENIYLKGQLLGMSRREIDLKYDEMVDFSGIEDFLDTQVKHYSDGMYLRLAFSVAFHSPAALLYLDEVISVGDANFRIKAHEKVREVIANGTTVILVSHQMSEITDLCSRVVLLKEGKIEKMGPTMEVVETYMDQVLVGLNRQLNHGNQDIYRLHGVQVAAAGKSPDQVILINDPIEIVFDIEKIDSTGSLELVLFLVDINGFQLVTDSYAMRLPYVPKMTQKGSYQVKTTLPGDLLNRGVYRLHLTVARNETQVLDQMLDIASFQVRIPMREQEEQRMVAITSALRIPLTWTITPEKGPRD